MQDTREYSEFIDKLNTFDGYVDLLLGQNIYDSLTWYRKLNLKWMWKKHRAIDIILGKTSFFIDKISVLINIRGDE